jgi:hypothetical protein
MVARDSRTHKARKINPLIVETPAERDLFEIASEHKARKQDSTRASLSRRPRHPGPRQGPRPHARDGNLGYVAGVTVDVMSCQRA